jgi:3-phosphoshikimate 1-carboxyvinyltransferase
MTYVCITGNEQSPAALEQRLERVIFGHPRVLCELRMDYLDLSPASAFAFLARLPAEMANRLILTQRLKASGSIASGQCGWDVLTWQSWWRDVMALRPWFAVDLDWLVLDRLAGESLAWRGKFRSRHAFFSIHGSLNEIGNSLPEIVASAKEHNAGVKIAAPVQSSREMAQLAEYTETLKDLPIHISVAMGATGRIWRWSKAAGDITYFSAEEGKSTAAGQETFSQVLPYLSTKHRPDLFALLGDNPENRYGEDIWNRVFLRRGAKQRYVNVPMSDEPGATWSENTLYWMDKLGVQGASITKPFKLSFPDPTNTLHKQENIWSRENTDGLAVWNILKEFQILPNSKIVIAGSGGAALCVKVFLEAKGFSVEIWKRENGKLGMCPEGDVFLSTWPGIYQEALIQALENKNSFCLIVDAQFQREENESPLAQWGRERNIRYVHGTHWWREQARAQDILWFGEDRLGSAKEAIKKMVPSSKSETLRALALGAACGVTTEIQGIAKNADTDYFLEALENLGIHVDRVGEKVTLFPNPDFEVPDRAIPVGEGATGFRILLAMSSLMEGKDLVLWAEKSLLDRPMEEFFQHYHVKAENPILVKTGNPLPSKISMDRSSQFATGVLIAAAGALYRGKISKFEIELEGDWKSESYLQLTLDFLEQAGIGIQRQEKHLQLFLKERKNRLQFSIDKDASSLAFLEVISKQLHLSSWMSSSKQGDSVFPELLKICDKPISLKNAPDLAPPLWAYAALKRNRMEIVDCPQLRWKESDRSLRLVEAAIQLGGTGEVTEGGFWVDFSERRVSGDEKIFLQTDGDHRLAMAYGVLGFFENQIEPDRKDCVKKSFPQFWQALQLLQEAIPG